MLATFAAATTLAATFSVGKGGQGIVVMGPEHALAVRGVDAGRGALVARRRLAGAARSTSRRPAWSSSAAHSSTRSRSTPTAGCRRSHSVDDLLLVTAGGEGSGWSAYLPSAAPTHPRAMPPAASVCPARRCRTAGPTAARCHGPRDRLPAGHRRAGRGAALAPPHVAPGWRPAGADRQRQAERARATGVLLGGGAASAVAGRERRGRTKPAAGHPLEDSDAAAIAPRADARSPPRRLRRVQRPLRDAVRDPRALADPGARAAARHAPSRRLGRERPARSPRVWRTPRVPAASRPPRRRGAVTARVPASRRPGAVTARRA